jgi:hypothetical protein
MRRLALAALLAAALAPAGCASRAAQHAPTSGPSQVAVTVTDPKGDAVDSDGNPRRGRPDVDVIAVEIDRGPNDLVRFTVVTRAAPRGPVRYEVFGQAAEVTGYDVVNIVRKHDTASGYVTFENSVARNRLTSFGYNRAQFSFDVPVDPILGATPFEWRVTVSTASGPLISDYLPSQRGLKSFPR